MTLALALTSGATLLLLAVHVYRPASSFLVFCFVKLTPEPIAIPSRVHVIFGSGCPDARQDNVKDPLSLTVASFGLEVTCGGTGGWMCHSIQSVSQSQLPQNYKWCTVIRIGNQLSSDHTKPWKAKFFALCDVMFLVRLQEKFEIDHSWESIVQHQALCSVRHVARATSRFCDWHGRGHSRAKEAS